MSPFEIQGRGRVEARESAAWSLPSIRGKKHGFRVSVAADPLIAMVKMKKSSSDVILLDLERLTPTRLIPPASVTSLANCISWSLKRRKSLASRKSAYHRRSQTGGGLLQPVQGKSPPCHLTPFASSRPCFLFLLVLLFWRRNRRRTVPVRWSLRDHRIWTPAFPSTSVSTIWFPA